MTITSSVAFGEAILEKYTDILIHIGPRLEAETYRVEAFLDHNPYSSPSQLRLDWQALYKAESNPQEYGRLLFKTLFPGSEPIHRAYYKAVGNAEGRTEGRLRFRLWIDDTAAELHALHWERLYHVHKGQDLPLAASTQIPFSRYTSLDKLEVQPVSERPIRILIAIANPRNLPPNLPPIDVEREVEYLSQELGDLRQTNLIQVTFMPGRSELSPDLEKQLNNTGYEIVKEVTSLDNILRRLPGYHAFHFLGHGHFQRQREHGPGVASLFLEEEDGSWAPVKDDELISHLAIADPLPHLVFLAACQSAYRETTGEHPFVGLGPKLVHAGVPAVVAMQDVVSMDLARQVTGNFYRRLINHGLVDRALNEARQLLFKQDETEWAIPVLFMRLAEGQLFVNEPISSAPFQAPPLPTYFVHRPDVSKALKQALTLDDASSTSGMLVVSAIHGLGGVGKSTHAAELANDLAVRRRFPDGILWIPLGQHPDLLSLLSGLIQDLGDYAYRPSNVEATSAHLRGLLQNRAVLIAIDDAWRADDVRVFKAGGPQCRMLITTREASIAEVMDATLYDLDVMTPEQALELITRRLGHELEGKEQEDALLLAERVGYLPLALELAAAQIADHVPWNELLEDLSEEIARLEALDRLLYFEEDIDDVTLKSLSLVASFNLSLRRLSEEIRSKFAWLGILPDDVTLTPLMTTTLWETNERESRKILLYLRGKALLLPGVPHPDGTPTYRLHDIQHAMARRLLAGSSDAVKIYHLPGLGLTLTNAHAALVERYQKRTENGLWSTLFGNEDIPDDGYIHARLTWHMEKAGQVRAIHALLSEEEERNAWFQKRERLGQTAGFLEDVSRAWKLAEKDSEECARREEPAPSISLEVRYALMVASLSTLAQNVPPILLTALVEKGLWPPAQGLAYALQVPEPEQRAKALVGLAPYLSEALREEMLWKAVAIARSIENGRERTKALARLALQLGNSGYIDKSLAVAKAISNTTELAEVLSALASRLTTLGYTETTLALIKAIKNKNDRITALVGLIPHLQEPRKSEVAKEAWTEVWKMKRNRKQVWLLAKLAPHLPESVKHSDLQRVLEAVENIRNVTHQAEVLLELAQQMTDEVLTVARRIKDEREKAKVLVKLSLYLPEHEGVEVQRNLLKSIRNASNEVYRAELLSDLAPHLLKQLHEMALDLANSIQDQQTKVNTLIGLAAYLSEPYRENTGREVLKAVQAIGDETERAEKLAELTPSLSEPLRQEVRTAAYFLRDPVCRVEVLTRLIPYLSEEQRSEEIHQALSTVGEIDDTLRRTQALVELVPYLPKSSLRRALVVVQAINDNQARSEALLALQKTGEHVDRRVKLINLTSWLNDLDYPRQVLIDGEQVQAEMLLIHGKADGESVEEEKLAGVVSQLVDLGHPQEALVVVRMISDLPKRLETLVDLVSQLMAIGYLREALIAVQMINNPAHRATVLARLVSTPSELLEGVAVQEALAAARTIEEASLRRAVLIRLVPYLPEDKRLLVLDEALVGLVDLTELLFREILTALKTIGDTVQRAEVLLGLMPRLPESQKAIAVQEILVAALMTDNVTQRAETLLKLLPCSSEPQEDGVLEEALKTAEMIANGEQRAQVLEALLPYLAGSQKTVVVGEAHNLISEVIHGEQRARALVGLLPHLTEAQNNTIVAEAIEAVETITNGIPWIEVLLKLMPYLTPPLQCNTNEVMLAVTRVRGNVARREEVVLRLVEAGYTQQALTAAKHIWSPMQRARALVKLLPHLTEPQKDAASAEALSTARTIRDSTKRAQVLVELLPHLAGAQKNTVADEALESVRIIWIPSTRRASLLVELLLHLAEPQKDIVAGEALSLIRNISEERRAQALVRSLLYLTMPLKDSVAREALVAAEMIRSPARKTQALVKLLPHLTGLQKDAVVQEALLSARRIEKPTKQAQALVELLLYLTGSQKNTVAGEVLRSVRTIWDSTQQGQVLMELLVDLTEPQEDVVAGESLSLIEEAMSGEQRALVKLLLHLSVPLKETVVEETLKATRTIRNLMRREQMLIELLPHLAESQVDVVVGEALPLIREVTSGEQQAKDLLRLLPLLTEPQRNIVVQEALKGIRTIGNPTKRTQMLVELLPYLIGSQKDIVIEEVLTVATQIWSPMQRARALVKLLPHLTGSQKDVAVQEALRAVRRIVDGEQRAQALVALLSSLAEPLKSAVVQEALRVVRRITGGEQRARALVGLLPHLTEPQRASVVQEASEAAETITKGIPWIEVLLKLMPYLRPPLQCSTDEVMLAVTRVRGNMTRREEVLLRLVDAGYTQQALTAARLIGNSIKQVQALVELLPHLTEPQEDTVAQEILETARMKGKVAHAYALVESLLYLSPPLKQAVANEALQAIKRIKNVTSRAPLLVKLLPHLTELQKDVVLEEALRTVRKIAGGEQRAQALVELLPQLAESQRAAVVQEALWAAETIDNGIPWIEVLLKLMPYLLPPLQCSTDEVTLAVARGRGDRASREGVLLRLVEAGYAQQALTAARLIGNSTKQLQVLVELLPHLAESQKGVGLEEALRAVRRIEDLLSRAQTLVELLPHLTESQKDTLIQETIVVPTTIGNVTSRVLALVSLLPHLTGSQKDEVLEDALRTAEMIAGGEQRARALVELLPQLTEPRRDTMVQEALRTVRKIAGGEQRAQALVALLPQLAEPQRATVVQEAVEAAETIDNGIPWIKVLLKLMPYLLPPLQYSTDEVTLAVTRVKGNRASREEVLLRLVEVGYAQQALTAARLIGNSTQRARALVELLPQLTEPQKIIVAGEALPLIREVIHGEQRAQVLVALLPQLAESQRTAVVQEAVEAAETIDDGIPWIEVLLKLMPYLLPPLQCSTDEVMLAVARGRGNKARREEVLLRLVDAGYAQQALTAARLITDGEQRAQALVELAPFLTGSQKNIVAGGVLNSSTTSRSGPRVMLQRDAVASEALRAAKLIINGERQAQVLVALLPHLTGSQRDIVVEETLRAARIIKDTAQREKVLVKLTNWLVESGYLWEDLKAVRAVARQLQPLMRKAHYLPEVKWLPLITTWLKAARTIEDTTKRVEVYSELAFLLENLSPVTLHLLWCETLHLSALRTRQELLADTAALARVITTLGGVEALAEIAYAIQDVGRWWP